MENFCDLHIPTSPREIHGIICETSYKYKLNAKLFINVAKIRKITIRHLFSVNSDETLSDWSMANKSFANNQSIDNNRNNTTTVVY